MLLEIAALVEFQKMMLAGCLDSHADTSPLTMESPYNILDWFAAPGGRTLAACAVAKPITYHFEFTDDQMAVRRDLFKRYGTSINALSKIVTRVGNVHSLFRTVRAVAEGSGK